jgi:endonuclease YncB( thermonuclease family)
MALAGLAWLLSAGLPAAEPQRWTLDALRLRLIDAGYAPDLKTGALMAEVELRFYNSSKTRRFSQSVQVQFVGPQAKVLGTWKTFLSLSPGQAQHRLVRAPSRLGCQAPLAACSPLSVRVVLKPGQALIPDAPVPPVLLSEDGAPPVGVPVYVGEVFDGFVLQLLGGHRVRLTGVAPQESPQLKAAAADYIRERVMDGPVTLSFDGEHRDAGGRWLVQVHAEDGGSLNQELVQKGLARLETVKP